MEFKFYPHKKVVIKRFRNTEVCVCVEGGGQQVLR